MVPGEDDLINVDEEWAGFVVNSDLVGVHENARLSVCGQGVCTNKGSLQADGPFELVFDVRGAGVILVD